jgi:hypothetical protein
MKLCKTCSKRKSCKEICEELKVALKKIETSKNHLTTTELGIKEENITLGYRDFNPSVLAENVPIEWSANDYDTDDWHYGKGEFKLRDIEPLSAEEKKKFDEYTTRSN